LNFPPNMAKTIEESLSLATKSKIVYYDLETTNLMQRTKSEGAEYNRASLAKQFSANSVGKFLNQYKNKRYWIPEIISIGALYIEDEFYIEMTPTCPINPEASKWNGYTIQSGKLFSNKNGREREVDRALEPKEGLEKFVNFLKRIAADTDSPSASGDDNQTKEKIVLVAHNNRGFDSLVLTTNLLRFDLDLPENVMMADSYDLTNHITLETRHRKLDDALQAWCNTEQAKPHTALNDAKYVKMVTDAGAKRLGFETYSAFLEKNWKELTFQMARRNDSL